MKKIINEIAKNNNVTPQEVQSDMEYAIDYAWSTNDVIREMFDYLKPTPAEFILKIAGKIKNSL